MPTPRLQISISFLDFFSGAGYSMGNIKTADGEVVRMPPVFQRTAPRLEGLQTAQPQWAPEGGPNSLRGQ